jgi:hypothetical protein
VNVENEAQRLKKVDSQTNLAVSSTNRNNRASSLEPGIS